MREACPYCLGGEIPNHFHGFVMATGEAVIAVPMGEVVDLPLVLTSERGGRLVGALAYPLLIRQAGQGALGVQHVVKLQCGLIDEAKAVQASFHAKRVWVRAAQLQETALGRQGAKQVEEGVSALGREGKVAAVPADRVRRALGVE